MNLSNLQPAEGSTHNQNKRLGRGELKAKLKVTAHKFTATAKAAIEAAGGEAVTI